MARDGFSSSTRRTIAERVNYLCSNPTCRKGTVGPQLDQARSLSQGVAAHIAGASPGGPRYDSQQSSEGRSSPQNGIWLCQNCAKLIDSDLLRHPVAMLKRWKETAEHIALKSLGQGLFALGASPPVQSPVMIPFSKTLALPSDLTKLFASPLPSEAQVSVLLEDINGFGQRIAVVGVTKANGDWQLHYFIRGEVGWQDETQIELNFQKYGFPKVTYIPGAPGALDVVHLTGSGTGVVHISHTLYRVGRDANKAILSFPHQFHVYGWGMPFGRELQLVDLQRPSALQQGAEFVLTYEVRYTIPDNAGPSEELLSEQIPRRVVWDEGLQLFGPATPEDDFALIDEMWSEDTNGFLTRNHDKLIALMSNGTATQRAFVREHLG